MNSTVESRLYYLDNLRALAMIAGIVFHAILAYSPLVHNFWITADSAQSRWVDAIAWFMHMFRMPLFFVIAGFFVAHLVVRRGIGGMLKNRALRILLPLIIFLPLCLGAIFAGIMAALGDVQQKSPIMQMIVNAPAGTPPPPPTTMHFWFLYNLVFFCLLVWVFAQLEWHWLRERIAALKPAAFIALFPLLLVPALLSVSMPYPAPDKFLPQLWSFGFFGVFFLLGYWMFRWEHFIDQFKGWWPRLLLGSLLAYAGYVYLMPAEINPMVTPPMSWQRVVGSMLEAYVALWMTLVCLVLGKTYLNRRSGFMRFLSDSSYWLYLVHVPILLEVQYRLLDKNWSLPVEFAISVTVTLGVGLVSYVALVRWTPIGWLLNGRRRKTSQSDTTAATSMASS